jgi:hypothetical protein
MTVPDTSFASARWPGTHEHKSLGVLTLNLRPQFSLCFNPHHADSNQNPGALVLLVTVPNAISYVLVCIYRVGI